MSLFVPLVACWAAFYFLGNQDELKVWRICLAGIMCGGMSEFSTGCGVSYQVSGGLERDS